MPVAPRIPEGTEKVADLAAGGLKSKVVRSRVVKSKTCIVWVFDVTTRDLTTFDSGESVADDPALEDRARENLQVEREADGEFLPAEDAERARGDQLVVLPDRALDRERVAAEL